MRSEKYIYIFLLILSFNLIAAEHEGCSAHKMLGTWNGELKLPGAVLNIVFHVKEESCGKFIATMDSPDQGAFGIPVNEVKIKGDSLILVVGSINGIYRGKINDNKEMLDGVWEQNNYSFDLNLKKGEKELSERDRPQEPEKPYPYYEEEVSFKGGEKDVILKGTLTLPDSSGKFPAVVLISGSGPQNRNEEVFGHKPFLVLADFLTRKGIAVLRFDERGVGESTGEYENVTSKDLARDVKSAVNYLRSRSEINNEKIGLIGHSEGGIIAPMIASEKHEDIAFIVLLGAPGLPGENILLAQSRLINEIEGMSEEYIKKTNRLNEKIYSMVRDNECREKIKEVLREGLKEMGEEPSEEYVNSQVKQLISPWFRFFLTYDPKNALEKVKCPVLAIGGEKDIQVPADENLKAIKNALKEAANTDYRIKKLDNLNHMLQEAETGAVTEYSKIEQTMSPKALNLIARWIRERI